MKIKEAIKWLENKPRFKEKTNLNKMKNALKILNNPEKNFQAIHVTGTNGKGSVSKFLSTTLKSEFKVGLFTSPYVVSFNERLQINNEPIKDNLLLKYINWVKEFDENYFLNYQDRFSFFELITLIAIKYFSDQKVTYAVIEVGIGGRLDSTNVIDAKYAVITSLGLDHVEQLGGSLKSILKEKLGVVKNKTILYTAVTNYEEIVKEHIKNKNSKVFYVKDEDYEVINNYPLSFEYKGVIYNPGVQGLFQIKNAILAIMVLKEIIKNPQNILKGINDTVNEGRFEIIQSDPLIILDGGHNYEAIDKLVISLKEIFKNKSIKVLYGSMLDKPYIKMIERLKDLTSDIYLTSLSLPRALKGFLHQSIKDLKTFKDPFKGYLTLKEGLSSNELLVVTGSMYLVSLIKNKINK